MENSFKSNLYALAAVFLWSTVATAFKLTLDGMSYAQLVFYSSVTSCLVLFAISFRNSKHRLKFIFHRNYLFKNLLLGFTNPFLYYIVLFKAYSILPAQEAQPLNYTWPIAISIFSAIFLKNKITIKTIIGLISAFIGILIIATRGELLNLHFHDTLGVVLAAGSSIIWASYWIMNLLDKRENSIKLFAAFFYGSILSGIYILLFDSFAVQSFSNLMGSIYIGIFEMGITFFLWMKGLQLSVNKSKTATLVYLSPFISLIFITLILGEKLFTSSIIGLVFIIGGILYQQFNFKKILKYGCQKSGDGWMHMR